jgi:uncharacterized protein
VLMTQVLERLGTRASVEWIADADHAFHVPARTGRKDAAIQEALLAAAAGWMLART